MPHPGAFKGSRKEFMLSQKQLYAEAVVTRYVKDALAIIQRRYFKRFPPDLPHDVEPDPAVLENIDDNDADDDDTDLPDEETMDPKTYEEAVQRLTNTQAIIIKRKKQIKRWLEYQYMKDNDIDPKESGLHNPFNILLFQLTGVGYQKPRLRSPVNVWRRTHCVEIEEESKALAANDQRAQRTKLIQLRERAAKEMFDKLSDEDKAYYKELAKEEHEEAVKKWEKDTTSPPLTTPEARQKAIQSLTRFLQPIADGVCEATGWKASFFIAGPEPAKGGRLNMLSVHSGTTRGHVKMNFARSEAVGYHKYLVPMFGDFLKKCYTIEECHQRALSSNEGFESLDALLHDSANAEVTDMGLPISSPSPPPQNDPCSSTAALPPTNAPLPPTAILTTSSEVQKASSASAPTPVSDSQINPPLPPASILPRSPSPIELPEESASDPGSQMATPNLVVSRSPSPALAFEYANSRMASPSFAPSHPPSPSASVSRPSQALVHSPTGPLTPSIHHNNTTGAHVVQVAPSDPTPISHHSPPLASKPTNPKKRQQPPDPQASIATPPAKKPRLPLKQTSPPTAQPSPAKKPRPKPRPTTRSHRPATQTTTSPNIIGESSSSTTPIAPIPPASSNAELTLANAPPPYTPIPATSSSSTPTNAPAWFKSAMHQFVILQENEDLGNDWCKLVGAWSDFERRVDYGSAQGSKERLNAKDRPDAVGKWIARARVSHYRPEINSLPAYRQSFVQWWKRLQPDWRLDGDEVLSQLDGDWEKLRVSGPNGVLSIMAALFYWGLAVQQSPTHKKAWLQFVKECTAILGRL